MKIIKIIPKLLLVGSLVVVAFIIGKSSTSEETIVSKIVQTAAPKPLLKYTIEHLASTKVPQRDIKTTERLSENDNFISYLFTHEYDPTLDGGTLKQTSGQINIPVKEGTYPIVVMIRGYVDQQIYETGIGTKNAAAFFADNGFITVAPDFLGYADSSSEAANIFETRFQTYTTVLSILSSLGSIKQWDQKHVFIWAHSNGGQIALTTLAITEGDYPTTLWAPVTKPFPYSVLYYTDESEDGGKFIRAELSKFENLYDTDKYSFTNYLDHIKAQLQFHQGTADGAIPVDWTSSVVNRLKALDVGVQYYVYPGADHNLRPSWDTVVKRDLDFFNSFLKQ